MSDEIMTQILAKKDEIAYLWHRAFEIANNECDHNAEELGKYTLEKIERLKQEIKELEDERLS